MRVKNAGCYNVACCPALKRRFLDMIDKLKSPLHSSAHRYRRVVIKAGSGLLTEGVGQLDFEVIRSLVDQIAYLHSFGADTLLVTSGAVAAGRHVLDIGEGRKNLPDRQVMASVGQGRLMHVYEQNFSRHEIIVAQALLSRRDLSDRHGYLNIRNTLMTLLERRVVPIVNENDVVAIEELTGENFGDNDTLSAMCANLIDADLLVLLGEIDGVYTKDPYVDPKADLIRVIDLARDDADRFAGPSIDGKGRGGMSTKIEAAKLATTSGVDVVIANGQEPDVLIKLVEGSNIGTLFPGSGSKFESRKRWLLSGLSESGRVQIDEGAANAIRNGNKSLLPAGVTKALGKFNRGDIISIVDPQLIRVAYGVTNYDSVDIEVIKGMQSSDIGSILANNFGEEVVHRNNMVVINEFDA